jgi:opacity protein-like surface antigen
MYATCCAALFATLSQVTSHAAPLPTVAPQGTTRPEDGDVQHSQRVGLTGLEPSHPMAQQLEAELRELGFVVVYEPNWRGIVGHDTYGLALAQLSVNAALFVQPGTPPAIDMVLRDPMTKALVVRRARVADDDPPSVHDRIVVARAIELWRASLREVRRAVAAPPPSLPPPEPPARAPEQAPPPALAMAIGPAGLVSTGGVGPSWGASLTLGLRMERLVIEAWTVAALEGAEVRRDQGSAEVRPGLAAAMISSASNLGGGWRSFLGAGLGAVWVVSEGRAAAPYRDQEDAIILGAALLRTGLSVLLTDALSLRADAGLGATWGEAEVRFDDEVVASWGRPLGVGHLGLEVGLW